MAQGPGVFPTFSSLALSVRRFFGRISRPGGSRGTLKRVPCEPSIAELRRWQRELNRVTALDTDPLSDPVELQDVIDAAKRLHKVPDLDWH